MSDYFGALFRATGLAGRPVAAAPALREVDVEVPVAGDAAVAEAPTDPRGASPASAANPSSAAVPSHPPTAAATPVGAAATGAADAVAGPARAPAAVGHADAAKAEPATTDAADAPAPIDLPAPSEVVSHPAVQAALRWVAADPQGQPQAPLQRPDPARSALATPAGRSSSPVPAIAATSAIAESPTRVDTIGAPPRVAASARAAPFDRPPRRPDDEPAVEVSIGSIHLRVDAPAAPQTTTRAAAAAAPAAPPSAARSGLARRALRRI
jgi:hypothetical protein